jgi:hypothetical protein
MATDAPEPEPVGDASSLPEQIGPADLEALNQALAELFGALRFARNCRRARHMGESAPSWLSAPRGVLSCGSNRCWRKPFTCR